MACIPTDDRDATDEAQTGALNYLGFEHQSEYTLSYPGAIYLTPIGDIFKCHTDGTRLRRKTKYPYYCCADDVCFGEDGRYLLEARKELLKVYSEEFKDFENNNIFIFPAVDDLKKAFDYKKVPSKTAFWFCTDWKG